jgi:thioredoxin 1
LQVHLESFKSNLLTHKPYALVNFSAPWCSLCRMLPPVLDRMAQEWPDTLEVIRINVDTEWQLARRYNIRTLPTLLLFRNGVETQRLCGFCNREDILRHCETIMHEYLR